ncbi:hypothetical protein EZS27_035429 [termite gut metagenome]|uniref:Uncharacterized protein n=2 Tax=termite gut metagenome TaxID=433724 RepID=A0A5J4PW52_9ZZZZ
MSKQALEEKDYELILSHLLDPENSPLPENLQEKLERTLQAARLLDDYPNDSHIINLMLAKYRITRTQVRKDISLAMELFKTNHTFDWDFWFAWQIKDQIELIRQAKLAGNLKEWNNAKKTLMQLIGEKPQISQDPRRMEKNIFYIQVNNNNGTSLNLDMDTVRKLPAEDIRKIMEVMYEPINEETATQMINS